MTDCSMDRNDIIPRTRAARVMTPSTWHARALDLAGVRGKAAREQLTHLLGDLSARGIDVERVCQVLVLASKVPDVRKAALRQRHHYTNLCVRAHDLATRVRRFHEAPPSAKAEDRAEIAHLASVDPLSAVADLIEGTVPKFEPWPERAGPRPIGIMSARRYLMTEIRLSRETRLSRDEADALLRLVGRHRPHAKPRG